MRFRASGLALREYGLAIRPDHVAEGEHTREFARELTRERCYEARIDPRRSSLPATTKAIGVLEAARKLGIDVPESSRSSGYDDVEAADFVGLTTIHQPLAETGARAVDRIDRVDLGRGTGSAPRRSCLFRSSSAGRPVPHRR